MQWAVPYNSVSLNPAIARTWNRWKKHSTQGDDCRPFGKQQQIEKRKIQGHTLSHMTTKCLTRNCNLATILIILDWINTVYYISKNRDSSLRQYNAARFLTKQLRRSWEKIADNSMLGKQCSRYKHKLVNKTSQTPRWMSGQMANWPWVTLVTILPKICDKLIRILQTILNGAFCE